MLTAVFKSLLRHLWLEMRMNTAVRHWGAVAPQRKPLWSIMYGRSQPQHRRADSIARSRFVHQAATKHFKDQHQRRLGGDDAV
jgi:hypothetical protein